MTIDKIDNHNAFRIVQMKQKILKLTVMGNMTGNKKASVVNEDNKNG